MRQKTIENAISIRLCKVEKEKVESKVEKEKTGSLHTRKPYANVMYFYHVLLITWMPEILPAFMQYFLQQAWSE